jgi:REP-associated tyrosine transposase
MGRQSRIFAPGISVHVIQRGNNRMAVFQMTADYEVFLALLRRAGDDRVDLHGFAVMTTHYHLIMTPQRPLALSKMMKLLDERYARYFNRAYGRTGTLWNGRYRCFPIDNDNYWLTCLRYIEQNAVRAGIVRTPEEYRWSSYSFHALGSGPQWLTEHHVYRALGATPEKRQEIYRGLCGSPLSDDQVVLARQGLVGVGLASDNSRTGVMPVSGSGLTGARLVSDITATVG